MEGSAWLDGGPLTPETATSMAARNATAKAETNAAVDAAIAPAAAAIEGALAATAATLAADPPAVAWVRQSMPRDRTKRETAMLWEYDALRARFDAAIEAAFRAGHSRGSGYNYNGWDFLEEDWQDYQAKLRKDAAGVGRAL